MCQASSPKPRKLQAASFKPQAASHKLQILKLQATSLKPRAASIKLQAASNKLLDNLSLIKFYASRSEVLDHDKCIVGMPHMEGYLVWRKCHFITLGYFQLYCKKVAINIIAQ